MDTVLIIIALLVGLLFGLMVGWFVGFTQGLDAGEGIDEEEALGFVPANDLDGYWW